MGSARKIISFCSQCRGYSPALSHHGCGPNCDIFYNVPPHQHVWSIVPRAGDNPSNKIHQMGHQRISSWVNTKIMLSLVESFFHFFLSRKTNSLKTLENNVKDRHRFKPTLRHEHRRAIMSLCHVCSMGLYKT